MFSICTSYNGYNKIPVSEGREYIKRAYKKLTGASKYTFSELGERYIRKYQELFDRVSLRIDGEDFSHIPTDERIKNMTHRANDNGLIAMLFDYGRYLLISLSSARQPANLQGIWSYKLIAPWRSSYTMNINTQMNYWAAKTVGLSECHIPFLCMIKEISESGNNFGLCGWSSWHRNDIWRFNTECGSSSNWGFWQMGGFWCVRHIWEHYIDTGDIKFLKEYYRVIKGAAEFLEDWMYENKDGRLTTCPSTYPENIYEYDGRI